MEVLDNYGRTIAAGTYVIYGGTGTIGKVSDIKTIEEDTWAKVDSTDLWYKSDTLQVVEKTDKLVKKATKEDLKERVKKMKKLVDEDVDMSTELCDGGG